MARMRVRSLGASGNVRRIAGPVKPMGTRELRRLVRARAEIARMAERPFPTNAELKAVGDAAVREFDEDAS